MSQEHRSPYLCHVLVCTNDRQGARKSCGETVGGELKERLKAAVAERGWRPRVRVSSSGCLGLCERGPNVMLYPQGIWLSGVGLDEVDAVLERIAALLGAAPDAPG